MCSRLETYSKLNEIDVDSTVAFKLKGKEALIRNIDEFTAFEKTLRNYDKFKFEEFMISLELFKFLIQLLIISDNNNRDSPIGSFGSIENIISFNTPLLFVAFIGLSD